MLTDRFDSALVYARCVHDGQKRKGTETPYISHLLAVASIVLESGGSEDEAIAALLHDAPEDQGGKPRLADIRARFGPRVAEIVEGCSDSLEEDPRKRLALPERHELYKRKLRESRDASVYLVSAADKLHNARSMLHDERTVGPEVWSRFKAGRAWQIRKFRAMLDVYKTLSEPGVARVAAELEMVIGELDGKR